MAKTQLNIRVGPATREKIDRLTERYGSQAQVIAVAVDRLFWSEIEKIGADEQPATSH